MPLYLRDSSAVCTQMQCVQVGGGQPHDGFSEVDAAAADGEGHVSQLVQLQPRGSNNDVSLQRATAAQHYAVLGKVGNHIRHHACPVLFQRLHKITIGQQTYALVPRVVTGREMWREALAEILHNAGNHVLLHQLRLLAAHAVEYLMRRHAHNTTARAHGCAPTCAPAAASRFSTARWRRQAWPAAAAPTNWQQGPCPRGTARMWGIAAEQSGTLPLPPPNTAHLQHGHVHAVIRQRWHNSHSSCA